MKNEQNFASSQCQLKNHFAGLLIATLLVVITSASCSPLRPQPWQEAGFSAEQIKTWRGFGFTPATALAWSQAGFSPQAANSWSNALLIRCQLSMVDAIHDATEWRARGFTAHKAADCLSNAITLNDALAWRRHDFSCREALPLVKAGASPDQAAVWKRSGFTAREAAACLSKAMALNDALTWRKHGFSCGEAQPWAMAGVNPEQADTWRQAGLYAKQAQLVRQYLSRGYSIKSTAFYIRHNITPSEVPALKRENDICHGHFEGIFQLVTMSPFATRGKCFGVGFVVMEQWFTPNAGLASILGSSNLALVNFSRPARKSEVGGIFLGQGAYQYKATDGALRTVPKLRWIGPLVGQ